MKRTLTGWLLGLATCFALGGFIALQVAMSYETAAATAQLQNADQAQPGWIQPTPTAVDLSTITDVTKPPLIGGRKPDQAPVFVTSQPEGVAAASAAISPTINVWYNSPQRFGTVGQPQEWINVLGNVTGTAPIARLTYSLNNGPATELHLGPDGYRLAYKGDFNVEIPRTGLTAGNNTLQLIATDTLSNVVTKLVTVAYQANTQWPLPTKIEWDKVNRLNEAIQIVDGKWALDNDQLRPVELGYDRLVTLGDIAWTDYEVVVPVTVKGIDKAGYIGVNNGPNWGIGVRWGSHFDAGNGTQPRTGWQNLGALVVYRWQPDFTEALQMFGFGGATLATNVDKPLAFETKYMVKLSVQSAPAPSTSYYRFKIWPANEREPLPWDMEAFGAAGEPSAGSVVLQAHYVDLRFGDISVKPLSSIKPKLTIQPSSNGTITATPLLPQYTYGERVTLQAIPALGYQLVSWGDDISGTNSTVNVYMTQDVVVNATFGEAPPPTIHYTNTANGGVTLTPQKEQYVYGEQVTFIATPQPGYMLAAWGGNVQGNANPLTLTMERDIQIAPQFIPAQAPFSDDFNTCTLNTTFWSFTDPVGDTTYALNGTQLTISLPAASDHDLWEAKNLAPRFMQTMENSDFDLVTKFESLLDKQYQMEGMIIEQDANNFLRTDFYADINGMYIFAATFAAGAPTIQINTPITPAGNQLYLRVTRAGDQWTVSYSFDGSNWTAAGTFTYQATISKAGFFAANAAGDSSPANTVIVDYFANMSAPLVNEDGKQFGLTTKTVGNGTIAVNPNKTSYACNEPITLTAVPQSGAVFSGWSGAVTGTSGSVVFNFTPGAIITGTFGVSRPDATLYLPLVAKP